MINLLLLLVGQQTRMELSERSVILLAKPPVVCFVCGQPQEDAIETGSGIVCIPDWKVGTGHTFDNFLGSWVKTGSQTRAAEPKAPRRISLLERWFGWLMRWFR